MKKFFFGSPLRILYTTGIAFFVLMLLVGLPYYTSQQQQRPHSPLHRFLKPSGSWGHGVGIVGSGMILLLFLYSARKKQLLGLRWGRLSRWLDVHIFFGIVGPALITLHTAMKFNGVVAIAYLAMLAVMMSGVFGRYIYMQIPRDTRGAVLSLEQIADKNRGITDVLENDINVPPDVLERINGLSSFEELGTKAGVRAVFLTLFDDLTLPHRIHRLRSDVHLRRGEIPSPLLDQIAGLAKEKCVLQRRIALLNTMKRIFHVWHVIHLPFAYVAVVIMFVHIIVTVSFGYRWIF